MNQEKCLELRNKYPSFYYKDFKVEEDREQYRLVFHFSIPELKDFLPSISIDKKGVVNHDIEYIKYLAFHIGLIELISYWKCTCSPSVIIEAGTIDEDQIKWFLKLYYYGLGEFFYRNGINLTIDDFMNIINSGEELSKPAIIYKGEGNLIAVGGGKDSAIALELLKNMDNTCFMINPKEPGIECISIAGYNEYIKITRTIDKNLLELNKGGYLNGHTPFSALIAFVSYLCAYLSNRKFIVLSNEGSANEETVIGTKINHQYSKTYEFEKDFNEYATKYLGNNIKYFSLLRCLNEVQIGLLFAHYEKYHHVFKSCNVGSKTIPWHWCGKCPKCLFVYIILSPFIAKEKMISIFGCDMYEDRELLPILLELLGYAETKPFECVGTYGEVRYAVSLAIEKRDNLPYLLQYYKDNYPMETDVDYRNIFNDVHDIDPEFLDIIKGELNRYV